MEDNDIAKHRFEALNLAYGILLQQYSSKAPNLLNTPPTTEKVIAEAEKIIEFMKVV